MNANQSSESHEGTCATHNTEWTGPPKCPTCQEEEELHAHAANSETPTNYEPRTTVKKLFQWKYLTCDGLLKRPETRGPHYEEDNSLKYGSWGSEDAAITALANFAERHKVSEEFVLVVSYEVSVAKSRE